MCDFTNSEGECITGEKCSDMKCSNQESVPTRVVEEKSFGIITFGKHKGKSWNQAPADYLKFLVSEKCETSIYNKDIARQVLASKGVVKNQLEWDFNAKEKK